ncbi:MAG: DUF2934 domain-containing protein [Amaricoccus sp.]
MSEEHQDQIRQRAHAIWLQQGCPDGQADQHWHQASAELAAETRPRPRRKAAAAGAPAPAKRRGAAPKQQQALS